LRVIVGLFEETLHEGALETVGHVVEMFPEREGGMEGGNGGSTSDDSVFADLFMAMANRTFTHIRAGNPPQECPELVSAFFDMSLRFLTFRRHVFFASPALSRLIDLALACLEVTMEEREVTRSVLRLLKDFFRTLQERPGESYVLSTLHLLSNEGRAAGLLTCTLAALAGGAPSTLWANYFEVFFALLQAWPVAAAAAAAAAGGEGGQQQQQQQGEVVLGRWVEAAVFDGQVLRAESFSKEDRQLLVQLIGMWGVGVKAKKQKLKLVLDDVLKIAASEMEVQALRNYLVG